VKVWLETGATCLSFQHAGRAAGPAPCASIAPPEQRTRTLGYQGATMPAPLKPCLSYKGRCCPKTSGADRPRGGRKRGAIQPLGSDGAPFAISLLEE